MRIFEEEHPNEMKDIEKTVMDLMEIEQADELFNVYFRLYSNLYYLSKNAREYLERNKN